MTLYDPSHTKASKATHSALHQFISGHGIPAILIMDGDQGDNFSKKWIHLCGLHKKDQHCSKAYKQNQNFVERFVQDTKRAVTIVKQATDVGNKYIFDIWSHISDVDNHMARRSLKWRTPLEVFTGETPDLRVIRFTWYQPVWYREWSAKAG